MSVLADHRMLSIAALLMALLLLGGCADLPAPSSGAPADDETEASESTEPADDESEPADDESEPGDGAEGDATDVAVELDEWSVAAMPETVTAGTVDMTASNVGQAPHELVIVRGTAEELPVDEDGAVDEDALGDDAVVAEIEGLRSGTEGAATIDLEAGDYTLLCNLVHIDGPITESHYKFGMVDDFTVTAAG